MDQNSGLGWDPIEHYKDVEVAERYDAERFSSLAGRTFDALEKASLRRAIRDIPKTARFVDVPCGTGRHAEVLLELGYRVVGVDISPAMLHVAQRKLGRFGDRFETVVYDARNLKEMGQTFDAALCARVLMHFPLREQIEFLRGVSEATKGPIVFSQSLSTPYHVFRRKLKTLIGNQPPAAYPVSEGELNELLEACGLRENRRARAMPLLSEAVMVCAVGIG